MVQLRPRKVLYNNEILYPDHIQRGVVWPELDGQQLDGQQLDGQLLEEKYIILDPEPVKNILRFLIGK